MAAPWTAPAPRRCDRASRPWRSPPGFVDAAGILTAPPFDVEGYLENISSCRLKYPELRILTGLEVGQPHRHRAQLAALLGKGRFERVLGSLHCLPDGDEFAEPFELFLRYPADEVMRAHLAEIPSLLAGPILFDVFTHIDYPVRSWPADAPPFAPARFEPEFRQALRAIAGVGLALEVSAKVPLDRMILAWWVEEGGRTVTFASDGHLPSAIGIGLDGVARLALSLGFEPRHRPEDPWALRESGRHRSPEGPRRTG